MVFDIKTRAALLEALTPFLIVVVFSGVLALAYFGYFQNEIFKYLPGGIYDPKTNEETLKAKERYLADLTKLSSFYDAHAQNTNHPVALIVPPKKDTATLFAHFESFAREHGLGLRVVTLGEKDIPRKGLNGIREFTVSLKLTNVDYPRLKTVLTDLESDARLIDITAFDFDPAGQALSVTGTMYHAGR